MYTSLRGVHSTMTAPAVGRLLWEGKQGIRRSWYSDLKKPKNEPEYAHCDAFLFKSAKRPIQRWFWSGKRSYIETVDLDTQPGWMIQDERVYPPFAVDGFWLPGDLVFVLIDAPCLPLPFHERRKWLEEQCVQLQSQGQWDSRWIFQLDAYRISDPNPSVLAAGTHHRMCVYDRRAYYAWKDVGYVWIYGGQTQEDHVSADRLLKLRHTIEGGDFEVEQDQQYTILSLADAADPPHYTTVVLQGGSVRSHRPPPASVDDFLHMKALRIKHRKAGIGVGAGNLYLEDDDEKEFRNYTGVLFEDEDDTFNFLVQKPDIHHIIVRLRGLPVVVTLDHFAEFVRVCLEKGSIRNRHLNVQQSFVAERVPGEARKCKLYLALKFEGTLLTQKQAWMKVPAKHDFAWMTTWGQDMTHSYWFGVYRTTRTGFKKPSDVLAYAQKTFKSLAVESEFYVDDAVSWPLPYCSMVESGPTFHPFAYDASDYDAGPLMLDVETRKVALESYAFRRSVWGDGKTLPFLTTLPEATRSVFAPYIVAIPLETTPVPFVDPMLLVDEPPAPVPKKTKKKVVAPPVAYIDPSLLVDEPAPKKKKKKAKVAEPYIDPALLVDEPVRKAKKKPPPRLFAAPVRPPSPLYPTIDLTSSPSSPRTPPTPVSYPVLAPERPPSPISYPSPEDMQALRDTFQSMPQAPEPAPLSKPSDDETRMLALWVALL